jgi:hypothetical protein
MIKIGQGDKIMTGIIQYLHDIKWEGRSNGNARKRTRNARANSPDLFTG